jgi:uncharacterized DUF497 family protein
MQVKSVTWLPNVEDKLLRKHNTLMSEVEEVLFGSPHIRFVEKGHHPDEDLYAAYGQTEEGRYLMVLFVLKAGRQALIISAREMDHKEQRSYDRRK